MVVMVLNWIINTSFRFHFPLIKCIIVGGWRNRPVTTTTTGISFVDFHEWKSLSWVFSFPPDKRGNFHACVYLFGYDHPTANFLSSSFRVKTLAATDRAWIVGKLDPLLVLLLLFCLNLCNSTEDHPKILISGYLITSRVTKCAKHIVEWFILQWSS